MNWLKRLYKAWGKNQSPEVNLTPDPAEEIEEMKQESAAALKKKKELLEIQRKLKKGQKMFNIHGHQIIAMNKKNAKRKYQNLINEQKEATK